MSDQRETLPAPAPSTTNRVRLGEELFGRLIAENPRAPGLCRMYADLRVEYVEAQANILEHGSIVMHPRTGSPIPNPYLIVRDAAGLAMRKMQAEGLRTGSVWS